MKKITKILSAVLALAMMATFVGCGSKKEAKKDTLVVGTEASFPPYEFTDDSGKIVGIDADIAKAVADKLDMKLEIKDMDFDSLIPAVQQGSVDIVFAGMTVDPERAESVNFTVSYAKGVQAIIVKEGSDIKTKDDLKGKKIGVQAGTTGDIYCTGNYGQDAVKQYKNGIVAVTALKNGQVDCVVIDIEPAKNYVKANEGLKVLESEYANEDYAAAVNKEDKEFLDKVNKAMNELKEDGTVKKIIDKYITAE